MQALSAVLGGAQSLHTNAWDEALALPTEASALLALRTQQVIAYESGVPSTADPLAGSYYIESTTNIIEQKATDYINRIDAMGGMLKAIEAGFVQKEIQESAYRYARALEEQRAIVVGVNAFRKEEEPIRGILQIDLGVEREQIDRLQALRKTRNAKKVEQGLKAIEEAVLHQKNIMHPLIEALESFTTLGEVSDLLRKHFGEYREASIV